MPKTSEATTTSTARRRSSRTQSVTSKAKALETSKVLEMNDDEIRMPAGYNPSDDSEEEYVPPTNDRRSRVLDFKIREGIRKEKGGRFKNYFIK